MKFDKNVPIPELKRSERYGFNKMEVGDSQFFDNQDHTDPAAQAARAMNYRGDKKYVIRMENNGVRIWRIK